MNKRKRLEITEPMLEQIQSVTGTTVSASEIVVYEAAAISTRPLTKFGSIFHGARPAREMLIDMARGVRSGEHSVPLHTLHQQGYELPVGRVFNGEVVEETDGSSTLLAQFYLPTTEADLVSKIDLAVLDEVSVGVKSKQGLCSKCGFDYFSAESDWSHLFDQTCENGHTIGQDGTHLQLVGLDNWMELSLVSRGASDNPKIRSRVKEVMPQATYDRLAADGKPVEALMLFTQPSMEMKPKMDPELKAMLEGMNSKFTALDASIATLTAGLPVEGVALTADESPEIVDLRTRLEAAEARLAEMVAADAARIAAAAAAEAEAAVEAAPAPAPAADPNIPHGGVAASAISDAKADHQVLSASAFKTNKPKTR